MPGNVKLGTGNEPDPDPTPYLYVSAETKTADLRKPYDPKKSVWVPDLEGEAGGFIEAMLQSDDGKKSVVLIGHEKKTFKSDQIAPMNPTKFEKCEDMADLTYLNEASVLWNLKSRYQSNLIYTYSGLFCVAVNPYKRFPIYTPTTVKIYMGKRRSEVPPHLFAISDKAYRDMILTHCNQSMLITGESGAGKTENTKKVISYFALVGARGEKKLSKKVSLEDQIVQTNPILEAFGNAKTARNDNSSRFGKFIRIHFNTQAKLAGCDIETYLLEKARITCQQEVERSYHIFYQMMQKAVPDLKAKCLLSNDIYDYHYVSQGKTSVPSIDDNEDLEFTHEAFNILHFTEEETFNIYKCVSAVMNMGELKFKQKGREEQCEPDDKERAEIVGELLGIDPQMMMKAFCKPKIKVGTEWVTKGQNIDQSTQSVAGIARGIYDRIFKFLVEKCNQTLVDPTTKKSVFIGVLDIAGFEIFNFNGFEQLCFNFCNEKLQQFFNHHTFVLEQEEYLKEGIDWAMVDFGMDLQNCINLFEKPMGILAILEEESLFPKATDKSFEEKLKANHLGKSGNFAKASTKTDRNAHFAIVHYAGTVSYNLTGWLEKNKDPLNDTVVELLKNGSNKLLVHAFSDHPGQSGDMDGPGSKGGRSKKGRGGPSKTVSTFYKAQLDALMTTLNATEPHFIRCIVPNGNKMPGQIDPGLVLHQLTCNGVLEGIRICMRGFPNRMPYAEFVTRYYILQASQLTKSGTTDLKKMADIICNSSLDKERFRIGKSKIFFRAGVLGYLEELRDEIVNKLIRYLQGACYGYIRRKVYNFKVKQREYIKVIQRNFRTFMRLRNWAWFGIVQKTRPLIGMINIEEEIQLLENAAVNAIKESEKEASEKKRLENDNKRLEEEKERLMRRIETEQGDLTQYEERLAKTATQKADLEVTLKESQEKLEAEERKRQGLHNQRMGLENDANGVRRELQELEDEVTKAEAEKAKRDHSIRGLNDEINSQEDAIQKLNKEKKFFQENTSRADEELQTANDKLQHLNMVKNKLEQTLDDLEDTLDREKRSKAETEKARRKLEADLKVNQEMMADIDRGKKDLESNVQRKEREIAEAINKLEGEQAHVSKQQRTIKEFQGRIEEHEEELEAERQARAKAERQRSDLGKELEELTERLEESCGATTAQIELNKRREMEVHKIRKDLEESAIQQEATLLSLKKKHQDAIAEMSEQIDQLNKLKAKAETEKATIKMQTDDLKAAHDHLCNEKAAADKTNKNLQIQVADLNRKFSEGELQLRDMDLQNQKSASENSELLKHLEELDVTISMLQKTKIQLTNTLEEAKRLCDDESKERQSLMGRYRTLEHEYDGTDAVYEEEKVAKDDLARLCKKAEEDANFWRLKYEQDGVAKIEELEHTKLKLQARLAECESTVDNLGTKLDNLEKSKAKLQSEIEDVSVHVEAAAAKANQMEKRIKQFDKIIGDWKRKADSLSQELDQSQKECRNVSSELFRVRSGYEESSVQLGDVKRENATLCDEIKDIMEQISEGGRNIHEIEKQRKRLETEKRELQVALEDAEAALEQEENKFLRAQVELGQVQQEIERRLNEKEEEFNNARKVHQKQAEQMQASIEAESKHKAEVLRTKKKLEADVQELEAALEHANNVAMEHNKTIHKYQDAIRISSVRLDDEQKSKAVARETLANAERRAHSLQNALEESRTMLEQADRARRSAEQEVQDCNESLSDLNAQNQSLLTSKRRAEAEMDTLKQELEDVTSEARIIEDKAHRTMLDAAKLSDELRLEQDSTNRLEAERKVAEHQIHELQARLDEAEANALKNGKKAAAKLESRIKELEAELDIEQRRLGDASKNLRKSERRIKELDFQYEEDRKQQEHMQDLVDKLQQKLRNFKKQIEEAEEIAALNLAKFRKAQVDVEEAEERADLSEQALAKFKAMNKSSRGTTPLPGQLY